MNLRNVILATVVVLFSSTLFAQDYPMPSSGTATYNNLPTWPYNERLVKFSGRFVDSTGVRDFQQPIRTYRAFGAAAIGDKVFMMIGTTFASYNKDAFFNTKLTPTGSNLQNIGVARSGLSPEKYLPFDASIYPEAKNSGWVTNVVDGQTWLRGFDADDRGYAYVAYTIFGWGVLKQSASGSMQLQKQVQNESGRVAAPYATRVFRKGTAYYVLVLDEGGSQTDLYDVTNPGAPAFMRSIKPGFKSAATIRETAGGTDDVIGVIDNTGKIAVYRASQITSGTMTPLATATANAGGKFQSIVADGDSGYLAAAESNSSSASVSLFRRTVSFAESKHSIGSTIIAGGIGAGAGHIAIWGFATSGYDIEVYRVGDSGLTPLGFNEYFKKYYTGTTGYAKPPGYIDMTKSMVGALAEHNGRKYLIVSAGGLGDVYELQTGGVSITVDSTATPKWGTPNPNSKNPTAGPYYGDSIPFTSTATDGAVTLRWDFGNPEANWQNSYTSNTKDIAAGTPFRRPYTNIQKGASLTRTVSASVATDSSRRAQMQLTLLAPAIRIGIKGLAGEVTASNQAFATPIVYGDEAIDASDGSIEGHYSIWSVSGGGQTALAPYSGFPINACGAQTLNLTTNYALYDVTGGVAVPREPSNAALYSNSLSNVSVNVQPYVAAVSVTGTGATGLTFKNASRVGSPSAFVPTGTFSVQWQLLEPSLTPVLDGNQQPIALSYTLPVSAINDDHSITDANSFAVAPGIITQGRIVRLTISIGSGDYAAASCASTAQSVANYEFKLPTPDIQVTGCANEGSPCTLTAIPATGTTSSDWKSYVWKVDGVQKSVQASFSPQLTQGTRVIELTVANVIGNGVASKQLAVGAPTCGTIPATAVSINYSGASGCSPYSGTNCTAGETVSFSPQAFGYIFQDCDIYSWDFGNGQTSSQKNPTATFQNGNFTVKLTVSNSSGTSASDTKVIRVGSGGGGGGTCTAPAGTVTVNYSGSQSDCAYNSGTCQKGEVITFTAYTFGYTFKSSCDSVYWEFGDGSTQTTSGTTSVTHTFPSSSSATQFTVKARVYNAAGQINGQVVVPVSGGGGNGGCATPGNFISINFSAPSGCNAANNTCQRGETITFTASSFGYVFQACDTFEWDFGDGATQTTTTTSVTHAYSSSGTSAEHVVKLRVKNSAGQSPLANATVKFPGGPVLPAPTNVQIGVSDTIGVNVDTQFTGSAVGTVTDWVWTFGDNTSSTQQNPVKKYTRAGQYTVTLIAKNGPNSASWAQVTKTVIVRDGKPFAYLLPAVIHASQGDGSQWRTDLQIYNPDPAFDPTKPLMLKFESGFAATKEVAVDASTYVKEDVMSLLTTSDGVQGAVVIRGIASDAKYVPQMWTRTYLQSPSGVGTYGQLIPAVLLDTQQGNSTGPKNYIIGGLRNDPRDGTNGYRTNIGIVNPTGNAVTVKLRVYENNDVILLSEQSVDIAAYSARQINGVSGPAGQAFTVRIASESGAPVVAYASMVDNVSNDPIYIAAQADDSTAGNSMSTQVVPGIGRLSNGNWKSDLTVYNPDASSGVQFDLSFHDQAGAKIAEATNLTLGPNKFMQLRDLVSAGVLVPSPTGDVYGTLKIVTKTPNATRHPITWGRTYSDQLSAGTFGQGIPAFAAANANVKPGAVAIIPGVRKDANYKTNLGVVSVSEIPATVEVTLLDRSTGAAIGNPVTFAVANGASVAPFDVFAAAGATTADRATAKIKVVNGGAVWAFASIIDQTTKDPEYVPATPLQ